MRTIVFKIGGDIKKDLRKLFQNPSTVKEGRETIYVKDWNQLLRILSPQRLHLLQRLIEFSDENVNKLSMKTNRKQEAVSRDLTILEKNGLITKTKKGKNVYPKLNAREIVIQLA